MNTQLDYLFSVTPPWIYVGQGEPERTKWVPSHFYSRQNLNVCVRRLRGNKMRTTQELMSELGAALQFFDGFGENWLALEECLEYLDEWMPSQAYVLVVERAEEVLSEEQPDQMIAFLKTLHDAGEWWSRPIIDNEWFNRAAVPFHVLLNTSQIASLPMDRISQAAQEAGVPIRL